MVWCDPPCSKQGIAGACFTANHEIHVLPWRRNERVPENPPALAVDLGATIIVAAITTTTSFGSIVAGEGDVKRF
jgi:hypothetical protein